MGKDILQFLIANYATHHSW